MVFPSHVNSACSPNLRINLKSVFHTKCYYTTFPSSHMLTKAAPNLRLHRRALLLEIFNQDIGVATKSLPNWPLLKSELDNNLLPELGSLIDNHKKTNYREYLNGCIAEHPNCIGPDDALPIDVVSSYIRLVVRKVIPHSFVGHNERGLKKLALSIVRGTPPLTMKQLLYYLPGRLDKGWLGKLTDPVARLHVAIKLLLWLATEFLPVAIKAVLYATRALTARYQPEYYTKRAYQSKATIAFNNLLQCGYIKKLPKEEFSSKSFDNKGLLRFLPKSNGLRPIVVRRISNPEILSKMKRAKLLMRTMLPKPIKLNEEWSKFRSVVLEAKAAGESGFIYFVRTDVRSAFVTVRHQKILEVLEKHISNLPAQVQVEERSLNPWVCKKLQRVAIQPKQQDSEESTDSTDIPPQPTTNPKPPLVQNISLVAVSRDSAHKTILQEINNQVVRYGLREFRMRVGLAQGGPLSNHLCNMTLEDMTQNHLSEFSTEDGRSVLWRVADDFLFLTLDAHMAKRFQEVTRKGFHSYGWHMNDSKGETNLENQGLATVSFNGAIFNLASLEVQAEFPLCAPDTVLNSISFRQNFNSVETLYERLLLSIGSLKLDPLYLNISTLRRSQVLEHICTAARLQALRFRALTRYLMAREVKDPETCQGVLDSLYRSIRLFSNSIFKILRSTASADTVDIPTTTEIRWLMNKALLQRTIGYTCAKLRIALKLEAHKLEQQIGPRLMEQLYTIFNNKQLPYS